MKIRGDFQSVSSPWLTCFPIAKMSKPQWDRDRNMAVIMDISVAHDQPPLLYNEN